MKNRIITIISILIFSSVRLYSQQYFKVQGKVTDQSTGEILIGASIKVGDSGKGTVSDTNGEFSIELKEGDYTIDIFYLGYKQAEEKVELRNDVYLAIKLMPKVITANEVIITESNPRDHVLTTETGVVELKMKDISSLPTLMGETDIVKILQLSPVAIHPSSLYR